MPPVGAPDWDTLLQQSEDLAARVSNQLMASDCAALWRLQALLSTCRSNTSEELNIR